MAFRYASDRFVEHVSRSGTGWSVYVFERGNDGKVASAATYEGGITLSAGGCEAFAAALLHAAKVLRDA